jgi:RNA polymerase sigma-70 factor (family 1)
MIVFNIFTAGGTINMKDIISYGDVELMREIKAGNMFAFDILYKKYSRKVYNFGYSILKSTEETENLIQDVFLNFWEDRLNIEKDSSIKSYIFTLTYNSAISVMRKKASESRYFEYLKTLQEAREEPVNLELEYNELSTRLDMIIKALPQRQKEIYLMHKIEELTYNQIAKRLNISVNTIENHMSRALKTIRRKLESYSVVGILFWYLFVMH